MSANMSSWRRNLKSMGQRMEAILVNDFPNISHDVTFIVGEEKEKISCHKLLLMAASPVFEAMFSQRHSRQSVSSGSEIVHSNSSIKSLKKPMSDELIISIPDVRPIGFKNLIRYVYTHIFNVNIKYAMSTLYAAHKYDIQELVQHCGELLHSKMSIENVVTCYQAALLLKDIELEKNSWEFIQRNAGELLDSEQFLELSEDNLCKFLKLNEMPSVSSEVDIFNAVLRWGNYQCKKAGKATSKVNVKFMLKNAIPLIRFPTMEHTEFIDTVEPSGMLGETECHNLCKYFLLSGERQLSVSKTLNYSFEKRSGQIFVLCYTTPADNFRVVNATACDSFIVTESTGNTIGNLQNQRLKSGYDYTIQQSSMNTGSVNTVTGNLRQKANLKLKGTLKLKAVGIVLPKTNVQLPTDVTVNLTLGSQGSYAAHYYYNTQHNTVAKKRVTKGMQIEYIEFDTAVSISPNVRYTIQVNSVDVQGTYSARTPSVNFLQYEHGLLETPTITWDTEDKRQLIFTFHPRNCVIWALQFEN